MPQDQDQILSLMNLSVSLLHEAYDRLESLCRVLPDSEHKRECSETARHIHVHLDNISSKMALLQG